ncbi:MAG: hypothetical protein AAF571_13435 [Verrucomicrobiota bacterium]
MQPIQSFIDSSFSFMWWKPFRKPNAHELDPHILNTSLSIAVESHGRWQLPIQDQLAECYPELGLLELSHYNRVCRDILQTARTLAHQPSRQSRYRGILPVSRTQTDTWKVYEQGMKHHYPWINESNLHAIYSFVRERHPAHTPLLHQSRYQS